MDPVPAYDLWAPSYDETDNLLVSLDDEIFGRLIGEVGVRGKTVLDVGCGTGRHWAQLLAEGPAHLSGVDASVGMLDRLRAKHPGASVTRVEDHVLAHLPDRSCDLLVSTLALAHFQDVNATMAEWARVLRPGGDIVLTDLHPEAVARGACTFEHERRTLLIRLDPRSLDAILAAAARSGLAPATFEERQIDDAVRSYFEKREATKMFNRLRGLPLIYGLRLRKPA